MNHDELSFDQLCDLFGYTPKRRPLDAKEASKLLGVTKDTLEGYRYRGVGPRYFSPNGSRKIWYAERDCLGWLAGGARHSTSEQIAA